MQAYCDKPEHINCDKPEPRHLRTCDGPRPTVERPSVSAAIERLAHRIDQLREVILRLNTSLEPIAPQQPCDPCGVKKEASVLTFVSQIMVQEDRLLELQSVVESLQGRLEL